MRNRLDTAMPKCNFDKLKTLIRGYGHGLYMFKCSITICRRDYFKCSNSRHINNETVKCSFHMTESDDDDDDDMVMGKCLLLLKLNGTNTGQTKNYAVSSILFR